MTREEAIDLLDNLIGMVDDNHNSDYDTALRMAIRSIEAWEKVEEEIDTYLWTEGFGSAYRNEIRNAINKALGEVGKTDG